MPENNVLCLFNVWTAAIDKVLSVRGARYGGGYRSSARYSVRTSSGARYTSTNTRIRVRTNSYRPWGSRSWHSYGPGYIYGYTYFTTRRHYYSNRDRGWWYFYFKKNLFLRNFYILYWQICRKEWHYRWQSNCSLTSEKQWQFKLVNVNFKK